MRHHREPSDTDSGTIRIHDDVIASIASLAATDIEGVKEIGKKFATPLFELLGKKCSAITVTIDAGGGVSLLIPLITQYGYNIPDVSNKVQENVRSALERTTDLSVKNINIVVQGVQR